MASEHRKIRAMRFQAAGDRRHHLVNEASRTIALGQLQALAIKENDDGTLDVIALATENKQRRAWYRDNLGAPYDGEEYRVQHPSRRWGAELDALQEEHGYEVIRGGLTEAEITAALDQLDRHRGREAVNSLRAAQTHIEASLDQGGSSTDQNLTALQTIKDQIAYFLEAAGDAIATQPTYRGVGQPRWRVGSLGWIVLGILAAAVAVVRAYML